MPKIIISGCNGRMGRALARLISQREGFEVAAGVDILSDKLDSFPVYADIREFPGDADVVVDFSNPSTLSSLLEYCINVKLPIVLCTTGYSARQLEEITRASCQIAIFRSGNMSLGVNLLSKLVRTTACVLGEDFDIEIVERHHNQKLDAPSGTAIMLAEAAAAAFPDGKDLIYERNSRREKRGKREIGISSVRGGTIVGQHEVIFAGNDELIELSHSAFSREVFATGALRAAAFMAGTDKPGMYNMDDLFGGIEVSL